MIVLLAPACARTCIGVIRELVSSFDNLDMLHAGTEFGCFDIA
jgi:hypothetical protein